MEHENQQDKLKVISYDKEKNKIIELEQKRVTFEDVGGLEEVKKKIKIDFIMPVQSPDIFKAFGKEIGGGLLILKHRKIKKRIKVHLLSMTINL